MMSLGGRLILPLVVVASGLVTNMGISAAQVKQIAVLPALESEKVFSAREDTRIGQAILNGLMDGLGNNREFKVVTGDQIKMLSGKKTIRECTLGARCNNDVFQSLTMRYGVNYWVSRVNSGYEVRVVLRDVKQAGAQVETFTVEGTDIRSLESQLREQASSTLVQALTETVDTNATMCKIEFDIKLKGAQKHNATIMINGELECSTDRSGQCEGTIPAGKPFIKVAAKDFTAFNKKVATNTLGNCDDGLKFRTELISSQTRIQAALKPGYSRREFTIGVEMGAGLKLGKSMTRGIWEDGFKTKPMIHRIKLTHKRGCYRSRSFKVTPQRGKVEKVIFAPLPFLAAFELEVVDVDGNHLDARATPDIGAQGPNTEMSVPGKAYLVVGSCASELEIKAKGYRTKVVGLSLTKGRKLEKPIVVTLRKAKRG